ncbi:MAG TPA: glycosyltransferase, partial [Pyrinomonadaceae bacterium]|nr:glycosyltransferase [Pyrinomonadaceae bacterium]
FRERHGLSDKFVVMYSGNHSPCHPLDTLLDAALKLKTRDDVAFCFVGGGSEYAKVRDFVSRHQLGNIKCLPYQPLDELSDSLSAADLHVVVMGEPFVGIVHPCKVYNIMSLGTPILYIGPESSHVTDLKYTILSSRHGDTDSVVTRILESREYERKPLNSFSKQILLPQFIDHLEVEPKSEPYSFVREVTLS